MAPVCVRCGHTADHHDLDSGCKVGNCPCPLFTAKIVAVERAVTGFAQKLFESRGQSDGSTVRFEVVVCMDCGGVVYDMTQHAAWHKANDITDE